jgi:biopolymer transport protein ExbD
MLSGHAAVVAAWLPEPLQEPDEYPLAAEINVTPLVDVMLVLLIIFIIAAPLMAMAMRVEAPPVAAPTREAQDTANSVTVQLAVQADGRVSIDRNAALPIPEAQATLCRLGTQQGNLILQIASADQTPYRQIMAAIAAAQQCRIQRITFATTLPGAAGAQ